MAESSILGAGEWCARLRNSTILCADSNIFMRRMICTILRQAGAHDIVETEDGPQTLQYLRLNTPNLIILDWNMRGLPGADALRIIGKSKRLRRHRVPILILSATPNAEMVRKAALMGAGSVLSKPIAPNLLMHKVQSLLAPDLPEQRERVYI